MSSSGSYSQAQARDPSRGGSGQSRGRPANREPSRTYSGTSGRRRSSVPGYDRERDATATSQAGLNLFGMPLLGAATGAGIGAEMDAALLGAAVGAVTAFLISIVVVRLFASRPMGR